MQLLPMKGLGEDVRRGQPLFSLMAGVPSLAIGLTALVLIASYLINQPIGPPQFSDRQAVVTGITSAGRTEIGCLASHLRRPANVNSTFTAVHFLRAPLRAPSPGGHGATALPVV
jgi:hypothetical protein